MLRILPMSHPEIEEFLDVRNQLEVILTVSLLIFIMVLLFLTISCSL